jgi:hypothetical protein
MINRGPNDESHPESKTIGLFIVRLLQITCLTLFLMIVANVFAGIIRTGPPPVPLDPRGRQYAPYTEYPYPST